MSDLIPPTPIDSQFNSWAWINWYKKIRDFINNASANLNHNDLQNIQGGGSTERYHLTSAQQSGLTGGSSTTLHKHDTLTSPTIATGIAADGSGLKHKRVTTGSVSAASTALVTITWGTAFADANYTVVAQVLDSTTSSLSLSVVHIESISASAVTVRVLNNAAGSLTGTVHVIAIHD